MRKLGLFAIIFILTIMIIPTKVMAEDYKLNIDDELYISVWGHSDLQQEVVIGPDGKISFPLIGNVKAKGLTVEELTNMVTKKLSNYINLQKSQVNVVLRNYQKMRVMILGQVKKPGTYQLSINTKVLDLISLAGGTNQVADLNNLKLTRDDSSSRIDLESLLEGKNLKENYSLQEGDVLYIPKATIEVSISGEISKPGRYQLKKGMRLSDLIAQAGGLTASAQDEAKYISQGKTKEVDLDQIFGTNNKENPILQDGDTIYIAEDKFNLTKISFWRNFFFFIGGLNQLNDLVN